MRLAPAVVAEHQPGKHITDVEEIALDRKDISYIDDLSPCVNLRKLSLVGNALASRESLHGLLHCKSLRMLNLSDNQLDELPPFTKLENLTVLNVSHNKLCYIPQTLSLLRSLKALILNDNQIASTANVEYLTTVNTLILSHNKLTDNAITGLGRMRHLTKLALAHNDLHRLPDMRGARELRELRLNDNRITGIERQLADCHSLQVIDLGNNLLRDFEFLRALAHLRHTIRNVNLRGNPIAKTDAEELAKRIREMFPELRVYNGDRVDARYLERRCKREAMRRRREHKETKKRRRTATHEAENAAENASSDEDETKE